MIKWFEDQCSKQMMAGNPNWWSLSDMRSQAQQPSFFLSPSPPLFPQYATGSPSLPSNSLADHNQELPQSWSQLLMAGLTSEEDKFGHSHFQSKKLENWEDQILNPSSRVPVFDVKQEFAQSSQLYNHGDDEFQTCRPFWSQVIPVSSPRSSVTSTLSTNVLDFSNNNGDGRNQYPEPDHSSECNSTAAGGVSKKAKVQSSATQPPLKVRKERLGDRITALHQLVSPFGKTDTASVLFEAISYIGFLQGQIEALSSPYLGNAPANMRHQQPGNQDAPKDLRSRGLCLVPVSCTHHVGSENGADYWAPSMGGSF